ncbi:MAG: hypothetical protein GY874_18735 [Desulfobacteraceae bacterium]|nr:hypothetical protein [Desulfobacteraceae bacterium]
MIKQLRRDLSVTKKHAEKITQRGNLDLDDRQLYPHDSAERLQQIEIQLREASQKLFNTNEKISGAVQKHRKVEQKQEAIVEMILCSKKELSNGRRELGQFRY